MPKILRKKNKKIAFRVDDEELLEVYEGEIKELRRQKQQLEKVLGKEQMDSEAFGTAAEKVFNILKNPMAMWKSEEYNDKRIVLLIYFEDKLMYDYKSGFGTEGLAYPIKLIGRLSRPINEDVEMSESDPESEKAF